jgi:glycosyltransferase involved in cell wall biosynthesis
LVLTDVVGNRDVVVDGRSGVLVPVGRPDVAAEAVLALLNDPPRRTALANAMRERLSEVFDVRKQGAAHQALYEELGRG